MGDVARPMLAEVLAVLATECTGVSASWCPVHGDCLCRWSDDSGPDFGSHSGCPLHGNDSHHSEECEGVDDAQERLIARGLLPEGWCGDVRRGWWCAVCSGRGAVTYQTEGGLEDDGCGVCAVDDPGATGGVRLTGYTPHAATIPDLVAVASLGWDAIHRAEEYALEAPARLREYGCPQPQRVVWRVGYRMLPGDFAWRMRGTYGVQRDGAASFPGFLALPVKAVAELWDSGLALDAITADAVRIVVPPVGGAR